MLNGRRVSKKTIPVTTALKRMKYLEINIPRRKNLHSENYKTLIKETEIDTNKWKGIPYS